MAVRKMQYVNIMGPVEQFDWVVEHCIVPYSFEPVKTDPQADNHFLMPFDEENPYDPAVASLRHGLELAGIPAAEAAEGAVPEVLPWKEEEITAFCTRLEEVAAEQQRMEDEKKRCQELMKQLAPLREMNIPFEQLLSVRFIDVRFGRMPYSSYQKLMTYGGESKVIFVPATIEKTVVWGIAFSARRDRENAMALLSSLYFRRAELPPEMHEDPDKFCAETEARIETIKTAQSELKRRTEREIGEHREMLCTAFRYYQSRQSRFGLRKYARKSDQMFSISGWVRQKNLPLLQKEADRDDNIILVAQSPRDNKDLKPPIRLWNLPVIRFFQMFVEMYGLPSYGEIDPTFLVAVTYTLFFGIMFGDVGQGLVLFLIGLLLWFKKKMPLARIIAVIGVASAAAGVFYGSVFGIEDWIPGFAILQGNHPIYLLLFAAGFGLVLIGLAMSLNIINGLRARDPGRWLFSPNGVMGFILFFGNVGAGLSLLLLKVNLWNAPYIICTTGVPLLALFFATPLTRLFTGVRPLLPAKPGEFFAESFFELFEVLLSYLSNVISYVRIGAFAISHAGMMLVVNGMAEMVGSPVARIVIMVVGNLFVIGLEGLIVGIQCLRLQFYEFFSRFYTGGGRRFAPVKLKK